MNDHPQRSKRLVIELDSRCMKPFDSYEIHGVHEFNEDGRKICEQVPDDQASFWTLCGHIPGDGAMEIGDFDSREHAEEAFQRITGIPFAGTREVQDRVRVMHAGPRLLEALQDAREWIINGEVDGVAFDELSVVDVLDAAVASVTGRAA
jgi:hypothetical protein